MEASNIDPAELDPAVLDWAARVSPGSTVTSFAVQALPGGAVARSVERLSLHLAGGGDPLELVRKDASRHEIAGLRAAQPLRGPDATAIPELVAWGRDWLITTLAPGAPLSWGDPAPGNLFDSLATLHARYLGTAATLPAAIPRIDPAWWHGLCLTWVGPQLDLAATRHPAETTARARALVSRAAEPPAAAALLGRLPATLLHGDVHPGNVLATAGHATLIDWGSCRIGPAALDLANLVAADSAEVARYSRTWERLTDGPVPAGTLDLGYRWAALQLPVQYLPWVAGNRPTGAVEAALDQIERALNALLRCDSIDP